MLFFRSTSSQFRLGLILIVNHKALTASKNILMTVLSTVRKSIWQKTTFLTGDQQPPTPIFKKNVNCGSLADHGLVFMDRTKKNKIKLDSAMQIIWISLVDTRRESLLSTAILYHSMRRFWCPSYRRGVRRGACK